MIKTAVLSFFFSLAGLVAGGVPGEPCPGCEFQRYDNEEEGFVFGVHISKYDTSPSTGLPGQFVIGEARCIGTNGNCVWTTTTCCSPTTPPCEMELKVIISNETGDSYGVFDPNRQNLPPACGPGNTEIPPVPPGSFENQTLQIGPYPLSCDGAYTRKTCYIRKVTHRVPSQTPGKARKSIDAVPRICCATI
jgi:hypothetical protein